MDEVFLENLPKTANMILNILWDRNHEMSVDELLEAVNGEFGSHCSRMDIREFAELLVQSDYVDRKRHGFKVSYVAIGSDSEA